MQARSRGPSSGNTSAKCPQNMFVEIEIEFLDLCVFYFFKFYLFVRIYAKQPPTWPDDSITKNKKRSEK